MHVLSQFLTLLRVNLVKLMSKTSLQGVNDVMNKGFRLIVWSLEGILYSLGTILIEFQVSCLTMKKK